MAVKWTITIEGKNEFGDICRKKVRIHKRWERLFDGDLGLSIEDGKKIMESLQNAVVNHEAETYSLHRRVCPDCHTFWAVKDYTTRRIGTVFGTVKVRNPRWMMCSDCYSGMVGAFAPLKEICPDRATSELMELTAQLASVISYRQAVNVLAKFLSVEPTETHATVRSVPSGSASGSTTRLQMKNGSRQGRWRSGINSKCRFLVIDAKSSSSASTPPMFVAPNQFSPKLRACCRPMRSRG
ncbi:hypothetical protein AJ87_41625 [Rhizobium yanglingense]|nr:hypothetical protein AJ87_41625 [Rhizobium yanglingense]